MSWTCPLCGTGNQESVLRCYCGNELSSDEELIPEEMKERNGDVKSDSVQQDQYVIDNKKFHANESLFAFLGAALFFVLNLATSGDVPGGFKGGACGAAIGIAVAWGINSYSMRK